MTDDEFALAVFKFMNKDFNAFRAALSKESDRGCALFAAAYLDKALLELIHLSVVDIKKADELFNRSAPLASFSSRITLAFFLGKISAECRRELNLIRTIRNDFAHHAEAIDFHFPAIANRCRTLDYSYHLKEASPRAHFTAAVSCILAIIQTTALQSTSPTQKPDDRPSEAEKQKHRELIDGYV